MQKTSRQLGIVLELQHRKMVKAEELAERFETSIRTIYRDIQTLNEAGVPVIGLPGIGYSLMEGYFLPPISFTSEEALTLLMGTEFIEQRFDERYSHSARSSRAKIEAILPKSIRTDADRVRESIRLLYKEEPDIGAREKAHIETLREALLARKKIRFTHHKRYKDATNNRETSRSAAPLGLVLVDGGWILIAQCDLRQDIRHFRVSRMSDLSIMDEHYQVPEDFRLHEYQPKDDRTVRIRARFDTKIADKVKESNLYYMEEAHLHDEGYDVTFRVREMEELLQWILGWGSEVVIIEPESFKSRVKEEIELMLKRY
ncbi:YafY family protein [Paenibacillus xylanexedens]|uniref:helix-turn-helix transcriptional regulator n=1 Tax=Paenibacillus xylanexedens TaxID=528191 RepID=UPI0011A633EB|nr:YafY family protein [Paenibacillus xylanexedens]